MENYILKKAISFLEEHYIDTEYYLTEEARELIEEGVLHLEYIESLPAHEMEYWLNIEKLLIEERAI